MLRNIHKLITIQTRSINTNNLKLITKNRFNYSQSNNIYQECYLNFQKEIKFDKKGEYMLFENANAETQRKYFIPIILLMFGVGCWCFKRAYNYQDRYKITIPFYLLAGALAFSRIRVGIFQYQKWISKISMLENGKDVCIYTRKYIIIPKEQIVDIKTISRPADDEQMNKLNKHFFKIIVDQNTDYFIPRDGVIHDKEILPAILNGNYITYQGQESSIIIE